MRARASRKGVRTRTGEAPPPTASAGNTTATCRRRLRPRATACAGPSSRWMRSSHELPEQTLEGVIERAHFQDAYRLVTRNARQCRREVACLQRLDHQSAAHRVERHAADGIQADKC